jgi:hypothetical protein
MGFDLKEAKTIQGMAFNTNQSVLVTSMKSLAT